VRCLLCPELSLRHGMLPIAVVHACLLRHSCTMLRRGCPAAVPVLSHLLPSFLCMLVGGAVHLVRMDESSGLARAVFWPALGGRLFGGRAILACRGHGRERL